MNKLLPSQHESVDPEAPVHVLELLVAPAGAHGLVLELVYDPNGLITASWRLGSAWCLVPEIGEA